MLQAKEWECRVESGAHYSSGVLMHYDADTSRMMTHVRPSGCQRSGTPSFANRRPTSQIVTLLAEEFLKRTWSHVQVTLTSCSNLCPLYNFQWTQSDCTVRPFGDYGVMGDEDAKEGRTTRAPGKQEGRSSIAYGFVVEWLLITRRHVFGWATTEMMADPQDLAIVAR
jgi:hypothetical protein